MAARKKQENINLLPQEEFASTTMGRVLAWLLSTFRVMVIITEVVVMGAFLSRFWLDARISDLNDLITQRRAIIEASAEFEQNFRDAQQKLGIFTEVSAEETSASDTLSTITGLLPNDITLVTYSFFQNQASVRGVSASERSIAQFIANLESADSIGEVSINQLGTAEGQTSQLTFTIQIQLEGG